MRIYIRYYLLLIFRWSQCYRVSVSGGTNKTQRGMHNTEAERKQYKN